MKLHFTKMHGTGNDYIYVDCSKRPLSNPEKTAVKLSDRHRSIGSDGLILVYPDEEADFRMSMFNADGSEGLMCGNGIRCVGSFVYSKGLTRKTQLSINTLSGIRHLSLHLDEQGAATSVTVDMGKASQDPASIPVLADVDQVIDYPLSVGQKKYKITCVSMGNPHCVVFGEDLDALPLESIGPLFECHPIFPQRINTEFAEVLSHRHLRMRVWERGSGETMACGTGACASVVAAVVKGYCPRDEEVTVTLLGGDLSIRYGDDGTVWMTGPAVIAYEGVVEI